ncbi:MAG: DUF3303 family protein [Gemmatimonadota bacterium]
MAAVGPCATLRLSAAHALHGHRDVPRRRPAPGLPALRGAGRLAPAGLGYVASWVTDDLRRCFQVMECDDPALLEE